MSYFDIFVESDKAYEVEFIFDDELFLMSTATPLPGTLPFSLLSVKLPPRFST